ncbi:hypothetical protein ACAG26_18740 [Mycobacterium sp. pUA109]|uniref:hypothetical protein n=1 Tax=Mycobacterium sp. pUA109 TaxID=3238982 RepID=UPI00351BC2C0
MAAVDDIDIAGADSMNQVAETVSALLSVPVSCLHDGRPYLQVDDRTRVLLYPHSDYPGQWIVEVYHAGDVATRQRLARRIYHHLADHTNWDLTLNSDDDPGYVVASRTKTHT